jgi:hypothetical protein
LIGLVALGPRATAARLVAACHALLQTMGFDARSGAPAPPDGSRQGAIPPPRAPTTGPAGRVDGLAVPPLSPPSPPSSVPSPPRPATVAPGQPSRAARRAGAVDPLHLDYLRAHRAQFVARDYEAALRAWDDYLSHPHSGSFELEARYNRAIALAQLGRIAEAREALRPFASGEHGEYRRRDATSLLGILPEQPHDDNAR